jgi:hypothetical protein
MTISARATSRVSAAIKKYQAVIADAMQDGPTFEALRQFDGRYLTPPAREKDKPDRDCLAMRFERFKSAA